MAKNYLDNLTEETRKGMLEKARQGLWPSRAPFGYLNVTRADGKRIIEPDPQVAPLIVRLFELYAAGDFPLTRLTEEARRLGLVYRKSQKPLPHAQIHVMLRNPIYLGEFDWKGVRYRGSDEPLVTRALWERVQDTLSGRAPRRRVRRRHQFAVSGLVHCGLCWDGGRWFLLVAERQKKRYVYRCEECKRRRRAVFVREEKLVEAYAEALATAPVPMAMIRAALDRHEPDRIDLASPRAEHAALQVRLDTAYDDRLACRIAPEYFDRRAAQWRSRMSELQQTLTEPSAGADSTNGVAALEPPELVSIFSETADSLLRRRIIASWHSNSIWRDGSPHAEWRQRADIIVEFGA